MKDLLRQYEERRPEIIFEWKDAESEAEGWIVINSLRGNAAGGGTRMRKGLDRREVESLAKTMEIKFTVSGPAKVGGQRRVPLSGHLHGNHSPSKRPQTTCVVGLEFREDAAVHRWPPNQTPGERNQWTQ